jgi:hypothetical protein
MTAPEQVTATVVSDCDVEAVAAVLLATVDNKARLSTLPVAWPIIFLLVSEAPWLWDWDANCKHTAVFPIILVIDIIHCK